MPETPHKASFNRAPVDPGSHFVEEDGHLHPMGRRFILIDSPPSIRLIFHSTASYRPFAIAPRRRDGATDGNRTRTFCLEGRYATVTSLPHIGGNFSCSTDRSTDFLWIESAIRLSVEAHRIERATIQCSPRRSSQTRRQVGSSSRPSDRWFISPSRYLDM